MIKNFYCEKEGHEENKIKNIGLYDNAGLIMDLFCTKCCMDNYELLKKDNKVEDFPKYIKELKIKLLQEAEDKSANFIQLEDPNENKFKNILDNIEIFINSLHKIAKEIKYIWDKYKVEKIVVPWNDKIEELYGKIYQASNFQE